MSCAASDPKFRLLDHLVGWDEAHVEQLVGLYDGGGMRLGALSSGLTEDAVSPFVPPARLARGCGDCEWYLATPSAPDSRLLSMGPCSNDWARVGPAACFPLDLHSVDAIAHDRHILALADKERGKVWMVRAPGWQIQGEIDAPEPVDLAFAEDWLAIASEAGSAIVMASRNGRVMGNWPGTLPGGTIARLAFDQEGLLWLLVEHCAGQFALFRQLSKSDQNFRQADLEELSGAFEPTGLTTSPNGFCLARGLENGEDGPVCFDWYGRAPCPGRDQFHAGPDQFGRQGQYLSVAIDSGEARCRWHKVSLDIDIPDGTAVEIAVATSEEPTPAPQGVAVGAWAGFSPGLPHPDDWQTFDGRIGEALIRQPVGRYLFVRVRMSGDGRTTPVLRRVHLDFPRATSADMLPAVYRSEADSTDFTERFLALFDEAMAEVERAVERFPAMLDPRQAPAEALPWLASFLDIALDNSWDTATRRRIMGAAPQLFRKRGTRAGMLQALQLVYGEGLAPVVEERGLERNWGSVARSADSEGSALPASARLGAIRLFSRKGSRVALGASKIGATPIKSYGDPAADAHSEGAFRFSVTLPPVARADPVALEQLVDSMKPGHTLANVSMANGTGFHLGTELKLGIDTLIRLPEPGALNDGKLALGRSSVLGGVPPSGAQVGTNTLTSSSSSCTES